MLKLIITHLLIRLSNVKNVHIRSKHQIKSEHVLPLKNVWSIVRKLTHNEILYFGYRILEYNPTALYAL